MGEPMTVLHLVDCLRMGGTERQLVGLLGRLDRRRYRSVVACFQRTGELLTATERSSALVEEFPLKGSLLQANTLKQLSRLRRLCKKERVRVIHAHDFYANLIAVSLGRSLGIPVVVSRRDLAHWLGPLQRRALAMTCRLADRVLCNATEVAALARADGVADDRICVIHNGIDVGAFDREAAAAHAADLASGRDSAPVIAMLGSMHLPDKGHGDLLEAADRLRQRGRRVTWWLASDGGLRPALEALSRALGLGDAVRFLGRRADVPALLSAADLVVHPSWAEGFPNVVLEAMCASRPVIATRVGGAAELIVDGATGVLVTPRQPAELVDAIEWLLVDRERAEQMGRMARRRIESRFTLLRTAAATEALYLSLFVGERGLARVA
jgi:glycosyltransferase involved in cell wall biosynthesis